MPKRSDTNADLVPYRTSNWGEHMRWQCPHCAFDSVNSDAFREHLKGHSQPPLPKQAATATYDRFGTEIKQEEEK